MKKFKANISLYEVSKLKQQQRYLLNELNAYPSLVVVISKYSQGIGKPLTNSTEKFLSIDAILIEDRSNSHTPPFLLTFELFNKNVHNCLVDSGASSNTMPKLVCS